MVEDTASVPARTWEPLEAAPPSRLQRTLGGIGWAFVWLGILTLGFVVHQLVVTTWLAQQSQSQLAAERQEYVETATVETIVISDEAATLPDGTRVAPSSGTSDPTAQAVALQVEAAPKPHEPFALLRVPSIERLEEGWNIVQGVTTKDLKTGAGHMPRTPLPGQPGNAVISGHRTTYGAPFHDLDQLTAGDTIEVDTAIGTHVYEVRETLVVKPNEIWVTNALPGSWLTLTTCNPRFSARQRLIIRAELVAGPNFEAVQVIESRL
ncbi:MAG: sortase [Acidimicrobiia bacterium]